MSNRFDFTKEVLKQFPSSLKETVEERKFLPKFLRKPVKKVSEFLFPKEQPKEEELAEMALVATPFGAPVKVAKTIKPAVSKLITAIKEAKPVRKGLEKLFTKERAKRAGAIENIFQKTTGEEAYIKSLGKLKGELTPQRPAFTELRQKLNQTDVNDLFTQVQRANIDIYDKITASNGLQKIFEGKIPPVSQLSLLEDVFGRDLIQAIRAQRPFGAKVKDILTEAVNIPRALMTSFDMSAPLRQGVIFAATKPKSAIKAGKEMFRQVFSQKNFNQWLLDVKKDPAYKLMKDSNLYIAETQKVAGGLSAREERFMTNFAQKIPVVGPIIKASERAYVGFLNKLRVDVFKNLSNKFIKDGVTPKESPEVFKSLANFVNTATGRGSLGAFNKVSQELNTLFFSPRLIAARFNMLNPAWYKKQSPQVRKEAIKSFAEFIGIGTSVLGLAKLGGADVEIDPRSTDFGKIKVGNTRWDIWGGFQQWVRVFSQIASGKRKTTTKKEVIDLSGKQFPFETRLDVATRFFRGKLSPMIGLGLEMFEGQKMFGQELSLKQEVIEKTVPLYLNDIREAIEQIGPEAIFEVGLPGFFGVGVQTYEEQEKTKTNRFNF